jgi:general secretion pathway protein H
MSQTGERAPPSAGPAAGFTLIELLVVLGILALVLAIALPLLPGAADRTALRTAAAEIAAGLRETRSLALAQGRSAAFTLDTAHRAYRVGDGAAWRALPAGVATEPFTAAQEQLDDATGDIRFFSDGSSTGGGVRVVQGKAGDEIRVDWLTGRVSSAPLAASPSPERERLHAH